MILNCVILVVLSTWLACARVEACEVVARTESGGVCGRVREAGAGVSYASFRSVPYAKQPLGELRFKELQPAEPWDILNATEDGPICPQTDIVYGRLATPVGMNESCIHANIHVPLDALPEYNSSQATGGNQTANATGLPILVSIHGGGFGYGSGNADVYGPEYLVSQGVIVITFNYRLNVLGYLSLNTSNVPGNAALRDMITLLKWVQRNAQYFGGDPAQVTLAGQSAGAAETHLLTLSDAAEGLFQRAIIMSGTALPTFYTTLPAYAKSIVTSLTSYLGINSTDPDVIYQELITLPIEDIMAVNTYLQDQKGLTVFFPVVESTFSGVTPVITADPEELILQGKGKDIPLLVGFTDIECEFFRPRLEAIDIVSVLEANPLAILPPVVTLNDNAAEMAQRLIDRYIGENITIDGYISACTDTFFTYGALKFSEYKQQVGGAPLYLYRFAYNAGNSSVKVALNPSYTGAAHCEDLSYVFKVNSVPVTYSESDAYIQSLLTSYVVNFIKTGNPTKNSTWLPVESDTIQYLNIENAVSSQIESETEQQKDVIVFYDSLRGITK